MPKLKYSTLLPLALVAGLISACSPGAFFFQKATNPTQYLPVNGACAGMDLGSANLNASSFRALLDCFNAHGALAPIAAMVNRLSDPQLQPIVDAANKYLLNNRGRMFDLETSYHTLNDTGVLKSLYGQIATLMAPQYQPVITSSIELLREGYYVSPSTWLHSAQGDPRMLGALSKLAPKLTTDNTAKIVDWGLTFARARDFVDFQTHFGPRSGERDLRALSDGMWTYIKQSGQAGHYDAAKAMIQGAARGDLLTAFDAIGGTDSPSITAQLSTLTSVFKASTQNNATIADGLSSLFHALNVPITCLEGAQSVPNGNLNVISELVGAGVTNPSDFIRKNEMMTLIVMEPFCNYPAQLATYLPSMLSFADMNAFGPSTQMMKEFARWTPAGTSGPANSPLIQMLIGMIADTGDDYASGIKNALPTLAELNDRNVYDDLMLLLFLPGLTNRADIQSSAAYLVAPWADLNNESIYDAMSTALRRVSLDAGYNVVTNIAPIVQSPTPLVEPLLSVARDAFYVNDAHPLLTLVQDFLSDAPTQGPLFDTVFLMSQMPEFNDSLTLTSAMATDGRLDQLVSSLFLLFHPWAVQGQHPVATTSEPAYVSFARHDLIGTDLAPYTLISTPLAANDPCKALTIGFHLENYGDPAYDTNLNNLTTCLQTTDNVAGLLAMVQYLRDLKINGTGLDYFTLQIQMVQQLNLAPDAAKYLSDAWITSFDDGQFNHLLDLLPIFVSNGYGSSGNQGDVLQPLVNLIARAYSGATLPALRDLETFGASVLQQTNAPSLLLYADNVDHVTPEPYSSPTATPMDQTRLARWVGNKECDRLAGTPAAQLPAAKALRAEEVNEDFDLALNNEDIVTINGRARERQQYSLTEFMGMANPILSKLRDPSQSVPDRPALNAVLNLMQYFTLADGAPAVVGQHYTPEYLLKWIHDRSTDQHLITYFYHDASGNYETTPRVKVVNTLDRLELTLIDADFAAPWPILTNSALQFTQEIGDAWGDEPRALWPAEIQAKYPPGKTPQTLAQVYAAMDKAQTEFENIIGLPKIDCTQVHDPNDPDDIADPKNSSGFSLPDWLPFLNIPTLKRALFNLREVLVVLQENLPLTDAERQDPNIGQKKPYGDGLKVLRDMFFEINYSTPAANQSPTKEWPNNLKIVTQLTRMGILHMVGEKVRQIPEGGTEWNALTDVIKTAVLAGANPSFPAIANAILKTEAPVVQSNGTTANQYLSDILIQQIVNLVDAGGDDSANMKQLAFYLLAETNQMNIIPDGVNGLKTAVLSDATLLTENGEWINDLLTSTTAAQFSRALYEDPNSDMKAELADVLRNLFAVNSTTQVATHVQSAMTILNAFYGDAPSRALWDSFKDRWDSMKLSVDYQARQPDITLFTDSALHLLEERPDMMAKPGALDTAERLRAYTAQLLLNGTIDEYLALIQKDPNKFYQLLQLLSTNEDNLQSFFNMARNSLAGPASASSNAKPQMTVPPLASQLFQLLQPAAAKPVAVRPSH